MIGEKVTVREGRSPRDTLSMNLLVIYLFEREIIKDSLSAIEKLSDPHGKAKEMTPRMSWGC